MLLMFLNSNSRSSSIQMSPFNCQTERHVSSTQIGVRTLWTVIVGRKYGILIFSPLCMNATTRGGRWPIDKSANFQLRRSRLPEPANLPQAGHVYTVHRKGAKEALKKKLAPNVIFLVAMWKRKLVLKMSWSFNMLNYFDNWKLWQAAPNSLSYVRCHLNSYQKCDFMFSRQCVRHGVWADVLGRRRGNAPDMNFKSGYACQPAFDNVTEHLIWKKRHHSFQIPHVSRATFATWQPHIFSVRSFAKLWSDTLKLIDWGNVDTSKQIILFVFVTATEGQKIRQDC